MTTAGDVPAAPAGERRTKVLVVGEALIDVVRTGPDGSDRREHVGGSPLNVAVGLARLGVDTVFVSQVGDDARGERIRAHLAASGVVFVGSGSSTAPTSVATASLAHDGSATYDFDVSWAVRDLPDPAGFDAVHVGSLGIVVEPGGRAVRDLVERARSQGLPIGFDPNVRLQFESDLQLWRRAFESVLPLVTHLKMSDEDAQALQPAAAIADLARMLAGDDRLVAVTRGAAGSHLATAAACCDTDPVAVQVADTIGAGDSYMAALLAWSARQGWAAPRAMVADDLGRMAAFAARAAAITCSRPGADPPWSAEIPTAHEGTNHHG